MELYLYVRPHICPSAMADWLVILFVGLETETCISHAALEGITRSLPSLPRLPSPADRRGGCCSRGWGWGRGSPHTPGKKSFPLTFQLMVLWLAQYSRSNCLDYRRENSFSSSFPCTISRTGHWLESTDKACPKGSRRRRTTKDKFSSVKVLWVTAAVHRHVVMRHQ